MFSAISSLFTTVLYQPLFNALVFIYDIIPDLGITIIIITVIIRVILLPLSKKAIESQKKMQELQPELKEIQEKYKNDKQKKGEEMMKLYKKRKINPAAGCLPLIIQLVILIALYRVFLNASIHFDNGSDLLYSFINAPESINPMSFGIIDITKRSIPLAIVAAGFQFWQTKMMMAKQKKTQQPKKDSGEPDFGTIMQQQMLYIAPIMTFVIGFQFPAGLPIYWIVTTLFMIGQQYYILHKEEKEDPKLEPVK
ncbi:MAG: YidC/Oxa1 family membrane protein insertase [Patescibacteria group bacterium]|jgi:YidC/Oxa1 family membrane protein insertase|nr:YidC/Oxa1 family membrane protein insertase [Patescibacteria group bacterium]